MAHRLGSLAVLAGLLLTFLLAAPPARADDKDYSDEDFSVRLAAAFIRFTEVTAGDGATAASRMTPAINPASMAWTRPPGRYGVVLAPYWSRIWFDAGTELDIVSEAGLWHSRRWGVFQPSFTQKRTNTATTRLGTTFDYEVDTVQLQWAKRWGRWAGGFALNYAAVSLQQDAGPLTVVDARSDVYRFRVGALYEPACRWLAGIAVEYAWANYWSDNIVPTPFGPMPFRDTGTQRQWVVRPGVSYEYRPMSTVFLDYQFGRFWNPRDRLYSHWFLIGVNHRVAPMLFLQGSVGADVRGNLTFAAGAALHFSTWGSVHAGYHYDRFPELRPEFGKSHSLEVVLSIRL